MGVTRRTYSHLAAAGRMPSAYEIVSSKLLYHRALGVSVDNPVTAFQARHRSELVFPEEGTFSDPRETTYASYVELARRRETFVSELFAQTDATAESRLAPPWLELLERVFAPLRYPGHGLMQLVSYLGSTATDSRRVIVLALTAGDELRRVHRFAERLVMLRRAHPSLGNAARTRWEQDAVFQPLRELVEKALTTYDVAKASLLTEIALKPAFDDFVHAALAAAAERHGDTTSSHLLGSLAEDAAWHANAAEGWLACLLAAPENRELIVSSLSASLPRAERALKPLVEAVGGEVEFERARSARRARLQRLGLAEIP